MTRGACLLLLLLFGWLLALPVLRLSEPSRRVAVVSSGAREAVVVAGEYLRLPSPAPVVPRSPLLARLPVPCRFDGVERPRVVWATPAEPDDRRDALRRVQLRRRLPRLGGDDPPWA